MTENEIRHFLFTNYQDTFSSLIVGKKEKVCWNDKNNCPSLSFIAQEITETKIEQLVNELDTLELKKEEYALKRDNENDIRADLVGQSIDGNYPIAIIELKKSDQTARQAFTELLAYNNYFCRKYPPLQQKQVLSILISPADKRTILDAYIQELLFNDNPILLLEPEDPTFESSQKLKIIYPNEDTYKIFDNALLNNDMFTSIIFSLPNISGWLDNNETKDNKPNSYTKKAMNTISNSIALELEKYNLHSIVYSTSVYQELDEIFPYPHSIIVAVINPFQLQQYVDDGYQNLSEDFREIAESNFWGYLFKVITPIFEFLTNHIDYEVNMPYWGSFKENPLSSGFVHYYNGYVTGILRSLYIKHMIISKELGFDLALGTDDIFTYPFDCFNMSRRLINIFDGLSTQNQLDIDY